MHVGDITLSANLIAVKMNLDLLVAVQGTVMTGRRICLC